MRTQMEARPRQGTTISRRNYLSGSSGLSFVPLIRGPKRTLSNPAVNNYLCVLNCGVALVRSTQGLFLSSAERTTP